MRSAMGKRLLSILLCLLAGCGQNSKPLSPAGAGGGSFPPSLGLDATPEENSAAEQLQQRKWAVGRVLITKGPVTSIGVPQGVTLQGGIPPDDLRLMATLPNLDNLQLRDVRLDDSSLALIGKLGTLKALGVSTTPGFRGATFPAAGARHLLGLPKLESLSLIGTDVTDEAIEILSASTTIRNLYLFQTKVTDRGIEAAGKMPQLEVLHLSEHVTDSGLQDLAGASSLKVLSLPLFARPPGITDAGLEEFRKVHPDCKVE